MAVNLSADLLRAFVTVSDLASYTKAGDVLGRTQPAISLQIRRLEELI
ncbi:MAG: LysR family transcriptional regulator, partial [Alphaproteobacteria bacterium]|nr:LysR family transcriptional regulator [Alphaproteobacteria bacterium]